MHSPNVIIAKKRDGEMLTGDEIASFISGYVDGHVPDYQMSAMAMAIYLRGMNTAETAAFTESMLRSGAVLEWTSPWPPKVDKHSTGGIGDKTSLILVPLLACCGLQVPMISGRGLGATGGTLDKLESINGFRTNLSREEIQHITESVGCVITGATADLAPADRKLYALRDVTATVSSIPLITASIMSKKLAEGLSALVLDVKFGSGAFMKTFEEARLLARSLVETGTRMGVKTTALLTDMNQPLGRTAGNALEVEESIAALRGEGPADLMEVTLALGAELLVSTGLDSNSVLATRRLKKLLDSGAGFCKFEEMITAQGGDLQAPRPLAMQHDVLAGRSGFVRSIDTEALGLAVIEMGGGRKKLTDKLNRSTGLEMRVRLGDYVDRGSLLVKIFAPDGLALRVCEMVLNAIHIADEIWQPDSLIAERVDATI